MNVIVLDDQQIVLDGMRSGVHWERYGVDQVHLTTSVQEAKRIISSEPIHILFCDIEMPGENGISVVSWVKTSYPEIKCIFLTSHADFSYAQSALQLGAEDYILQPAPYEAIEAALQKAVDQILTDQRKKLLFQYGKYVERKKTNLTGDLLGNLLHGHIVNYKQFCQDLHFLHPRFSQDSSIVAVLLQVLDRHVLTIWSEEDFRWSMENILQELLDSSGTEALLYCESWSEYIFLFSDIPESEIKRNCEEILRKLTEVLKCRFTCYASDPGSLKNVSAAYDILRQNVKNNVFLQDGFFNAEQAKTNLGSTVELTENTYNYWKSALERDMVHHVQKEVNRYLLLLKQTKTANFITLLNFHQKLSQLFLHILSIRNQDLSKIFSEEYSYQDFNEGYQTINDLQHTADFVFKTLSNLQSVQEDTPSYVDQAKAYLLENLDKTVLVQEVADHVGLTPDYLSRCFKRETGVTLKDYSTAVKIEAAQKKLRAGKSSVSEIASALGYDNVSNFIQIFKKITGLTPNEFRKKG